ncbi:MAG: SDR family NAD(P)-dependent oxidoreductase [Robiginitomaculum sp.]|nr:SDR family NAD(P)-dependent oxidoreductase [Robiginitomaculum sp.]
MSIEQIYHGKICVITGAASGIGRALAVRLAAAGAVVAISDFNDEGLAETAALIGSENSNSILVDHLDVADADAIAAYAPHVQAALGDADYVFNVAGLTRVGNFDEMPLSSMEKVIDVNFWGVVRMCKAFLPQVKKTRGGLINVASIFGVIGYGGQTHYCASKFAVRGFSETLAQEMVEHGVRVSAVCPGGVATNITRNAQIDALPKEVQSKEEIDQRFDKIAITTPDKAAQIILDGAAKGKLQILVGKDAKRTAWIQRIFPQYYVKLLARARKKGTDSL